MRRKRKKPSVGPACTLESTGDFKMTDAQVTFLR
jgi:hypothetical protein